MHAFMRAALHAAAGAGRRSDLGQACINTALRKFLGEPACTVCVSARPRCGLVSPKSHATSLPPRRARRSGARSMPQAGVPFSKQSWVMRCARGRRQGQDRLPGRAGRAALARLRALR